MTDHAAKRDRMVVEQIEARGVKDPVVLSAMRAIPRHRFIPTTNQDLAYRDGPVGIGEGQTISQPYLVAMMSEALRVEPGMRVLEIGTGSGYQTAVLCAIGARVFSIEIRPHLAERASSILTEVGAKDVLLEIGNGFSGMEAHAPFDRIIVTASPPTVPPALVAQIKPDGEMLIPVGERSAQHLLRVIPNERGWREEPLLPVLFVPMTGD